LDADLSSFAGLSTVDEGYLVSHECRVDAAVAFGEVGSLGTEALAMLASQQFLLLGISVETSDFGGAGL